MPTYASVVSRESVRVAFTIAALNDLKVSSADVEGAYLCSPAREALYTKCGPEFGEDEDKWAIITRAVYGLSSAAVSWRTEISRVIEGLGFKSCRADPDVWFRPATKADGLDIYEYILVYSDDTLCIGMNPDEVMCQIQQHFKFKNDLWEEPTQYLGANIGTDYEEAIPEDAPEPRGNPLQMTCFCDSDHSGDVVSRRSRTSVLIKCGMAPIAWISKKQGSIETSSFGSELTALKTAVETVEGLRYKLRMMGIRLEGPCHIKVDNMSVVHNCSNPASQLKKKSNSIAYHYVRERMSGKHPVGRVSYIPTQENQADGGSKVLSGELKRKLMEEILY